MAAYQYLTPEDQAEIVAEVIGARRTPEQVLREHEAAHFRSVIEAKAGLHGAPDAYEPPNTAREAAETAALEAEAVKLPAPPVKAGLEAEEAVRG